MDISELVVQGLQNIRQRFYQDKADRIFHRDKLALTKAIARYGYECERRGWEIDCPYILGDLISLLNRVQSQQADIQYLPAYLDHCVSQHIDQRADWLSHQAKTKVMTRNITKIMEGLETVVIRQPTTCETLAEIFTAIHHRKRKQPIKEKKAKQIEMRL